MKAVGVKILKARLSEYLRLVKTGETVLVTERDEVIAELRPAHRQEVVATALEDGLQQLADRGAATLRSEDFRGWTGLKPAIRVKGLSSQALLDSVREDSR